MGGGKELGEEEGRRGRGEEEAEGCEVPGVKWRWS